MPTGNKLASWDQYEIVQGQVKFLIEEEGHSEEEAEQMAASDCDLFQIEYDDLKDYLTELMKERELQGPVYIEVNGFGWRSLNGQQFTDVETGEQLLRAILPNTDCTFHIYDYTNGEVKGLAVNNFHHDSPVGREWYYVLPARSCEMCGDYLPIDQGGVVCPECGELICYDCFERYVDEDHLCSNCEATYPPELISTVCPQELVNAI